jgi:metal-responsive CopG/Arc/MetJ family transcriptional regulator
MARQRIPVDITLNKILVQDIDSSRGLVSRSKWIENILRTGSTLYKGCYD